MPFVSLPNSFDHCIAHLRQQAHNTQQLHFLGDGTELWHMHEQRRTLLIRERKRAIVDVIAGTA